MIAESYPFHGINCHDLDTVIIKIKHVFFLIQRWILNGPDSGFTEKTAGQILALQENDVTRAEDFPRK